MASKIRIAARLRPSLPGEVRDDAVGVLKDESGSFITVVHPRDASQHFKFPFSSCYDQNSRQEEIYENDVKPLLDIVLTGVVRETVLLYGLTPHLNQLHADSDRIRIWRYLVRKDAHDTRY